MHVGGGMMRNMPGEPPVAGDRTIDHVIETVEQQIFENQEVASYRNQAKIVER